MSDNSGNNSSRDSNKLPYTPGTILYHDHIKLPNQCGCKYPKLKVITHESLKFYNFERGFMEFICGHLENIRLYFDFDKIKDEAEYLDVLKWLDTLKPVFGPYSLGGYTDDQHMATMYHYRLYPEGKHFLSIHVVFYTTAINVKELMRIMRHNIKVGFTNYDIHPAADPHVYKLLTRQCFRHVLSDKIYTKRKKMNKGPIEESDWFSTGHSTENVANHGNMIGDQLPELQIITPKTTDRVIPKSEWSTVLHEHDTIMVKDKSPDLYGKIVAIMKYSSPEAPILLTKAEMGELLSYFEPNFNCLLRTLRSLRRSPYTIEFLYDTLFEWYNKCKHVTPPEDSISGLIDSYYKYDSSNNWLKYLLPYLNITIEGIDNNEIEAENNQPIEERPPDESGNTRPQHSHACRDYAYRDDPEKSKKSHCKCNCEACKKAKKGKEANQQHTSDESSSTEDECDDDC